MSHLFLEEDHKVLQILRNSNHFWHKPSPYEYVSSVSLWVIGTHGAQASGLNLESKPPCRAQQGEHCIYVTFSAMLYRTSSIFMQVGSQSCPKRMTTTRSSSERMAWSTCQPLCKCGSMYDILRTPARPDAASYLWVERAEVATPPGPQEHGLHPRLSA